MFDLKLKLVPKLHVSDLYSIIINGFDYTTAKYNMQFHLNYWFNLK